MRPPKRRGLSGHLWKVVVYKNRTTGCLFQGEFRTRLKIIHCKQFLFRKICISILFLITLLILFVSRTVQRTYTSDHASSGHLQEVVVYERFELKSVDGALDRRSLTTCGRICQRALASIVTGLVGINYQAACQTNPAQPSQSHIETICYPNMVVNMKVLLLKLIKRS